MKQPVWNKLKAETNNNYVYRSNYAKMKIPENARCDICNKTALDSDELTDSKRDEIRKKHHIRYGLFSLEIRVDSYSILLLVLLAML
jgi:hypothetical protein